MDTTTEAIRLGLEMAQIRAQVASTNIARGNQPGALLRHADFSDALAALQQAARMPGEGTNLAAFTPQVLLASVHDTGQAAGSASLDDQVAELSSQGVTYRALADGLSRRFALMQLAIAGK